MAFEKLEKKINQINKKIKQGRLSQEIADEISNVINEVEELGGDAKEKFKSGINNMKNALKKMK
ncbi:hypothetical protein [Clostridium celatum]|uniref:hypothetical protein n=1 Tax=Clostridium celatum TaxID=36834 RepID=UPI001899B7CE|nr:hypothetical protein [Clostridium celatum]MCE9655039.1 hypothetical protein [Clostridium celatum]MDU2266474.1 hypothetical protein [Clostridium celatum]MDU3723298.1 hypothetical protein [Clostridium celatum]MDU6296766.1 hypothetical protein [Clostridium celatum]MDY3362084.1 hypothetical protein [Clostridium celatum]